MARKKPESNIEPELPAVQTEAANQPIVPKRTRQRSKPSEPLDIAAEPTKPASRRRAKEAQPTLIEDVDNAVEPAPKRARSRKKAPKTDVLGFDLMDEAGTFVVLEWRPISARTTSKPPGTGAPDPDRRSRRRGRRRAEPAGDHVPDGTSSE